MPFPTPLSTPLNNGMDLLHRNKDVSFFLMNWNAVCIHIVVKSISADPAHDVLLKRKT